MSHGAIAGRLGIGRSQVATVLGSMNGSKPDVATVTTIDGRTYPARRPSPDAVAERRRIVAELHAAGDSIDSIAGRLGVGRSTVHRDLHAAAE